MLGIDVDDIIFESYPAINKFVKDEFNIDLPTPENFQILDNYLTKEQMKYVFDNVLITDYYLEPIYPCIDLICSFYDKYQIPLVFITNRSRHLEGHTYSLLEKYLREIPFKLIITNNKLEEANKNNIKYFIEDRHSTAENLAKGRITVFLRNRNWNRFRDDHPNIIRFDIFEEIKSFLKI